MNKYTIKDLKEKGVPSRDFISGMFYDWFCVDSSLGRRGETCLIRLSTVVRACPQKFSDDDTIDITNNCPCFGGTYDCVRVWDKDGNFKYAFVPKENGGGCSLMEGDDGEIVTFGNWNELKKSFGA